MQPNDGMDDDQKEELTQVFNAHAKNGRISNINHFAKLMMDCGQLLSPAELQQKMGGGLDLAGFLKMMATATVVASKEEDLIEAFKVFDKDGSGRMQITDLRYVLVGLGDKLDNDQAEEILSRVSTKDGQFDYRQLIQQYK